MATAHPGISRSADTWRPGSWEPGRLGIVDSIAVTGVLIVLAAIRGFDYLTPAAGPGPTPTPALHVVEAAFPLPVWGLMFLVPAAVLAVAVTLRIHGAVWAGHWIIAIVYLGLMIGLLLEFLARPWFDGIRSATTLILPLYLHVLIAIRTGWRPPQWTPTRSRA